MIVTKCDEKETN